MIRNMLIAANIVALAIVPAKTETGGYNLGDKVDNFKLRGVQGKTISLSDYNDEKGVIVIFTCNHCPFSKAYENRISELHNKYSPKGYPVVAINPNDAKRVPEDSFENMVKRSREKKFTFPYLHDESQSTARKFGASRTPHVFVLEREDDAFTVMYIGAIDDNVDDPAAVKKHYLENAVNELLDGKEVSNNFTKAIGCTIKWKS